MALVDRGTGPLRVGGRQGVRPLIAAIEQFSSEGGMLPEQIWDAPDLPGQGMFLGRPSGAAMPLAWAHAEYIKLLRSCEDGEVFDRVGPVHSRYGGARRDLPIEICKRGHLLTQIAMGKNYASCRVQSFPGGLDPGRLENAADNRVKIYGGVRLLRGYSDWPTGADRPGVYPVLAGRGPLGRQEL